MPRSLAGEYYQGDGWGMNLLLKLDSEGRYDLTWQTDDRQSDRSHGRTEATEGYLSFLPSEPDRHNLTARVTSPRLLPIRWGQRSYLLRDTETDLLRFCNATNLGLEPRSSMYGIFFLRMMFDKKALAGEAEAKLERADGTPNLPKPWDMRVLKKVLEGRIVDVRKRLEAQIDLGSRQGIYEGMELFVEGERQRRITPYCLVKVTATRLETSTVKLRNENSFRELEKGQKVSSKIPDAVFETAIPSDFCFMMGAVKD